MPKTLIAILYVISIVLVVVGIILLIQSIPGGTTTVNQYGGRTTTPGNVALFVISLLLIIFGSMPLVASLVGALLNVLRIPDWTWFICLIVFSVIAIPVYLFIGPGAPRRVADQSTTTPTYQV